MTRTPRIAIVGGGIGGLAAALALRLRGIEAVVYERASRLDDIGGRLNLSPNALKALRALGLEDAAIRMGFRSDFQVIRSWRSGRILSKLQRSGSIADRFGAAFLTVHRADLQQVIRRALPDDAVQLGRSCTGVETGPGGAIATFTDGSTVETDIVIGADGIHSAVRTSLFGADEPRFTGCVCWRGLVPVEALPAGSLSREMTSWWGPHGHVVHYPVRGGKLINFGAHHDSDGWMDESWTHECDPAEAITAYARRHPSLTQLFAAAPHHYKWALFDRDPLDVWGKGRISLLGDAAHPMLPYLGQGACMAMEDGCVLADVIAATPEDSEEALRRYERLRMPRTRRAQLGSRFRARENHLSSPLARLRRDLKLAWRYRFGRDNTPNQAAWIYDYDVNRAAGT